MTWSRVGLLACLVVAAAAGPAAAQGVLTAKDVSIGLAQTIAQGTLEQCRKEGLRVTVTVANRAGQPILVMRDDGTSPHTFDTSRRKAYTAVALRAASGDLAQRVAANPGLTALKDITDVIFLAGGLPIRVGNEVIGGVGVGGAPSGDQDAACAKAGIDLVADQLK